FAKHLVLFFLIKAPEVGHFSRSENLNAFVGEKLVESGEGESGTVDAAFADDAIDSGGAGHEFHFQLLAVRFEEVGNGDAFGAFNRRLHGRERLEIEILAEIEFSALRVVDEE